mgnify:CR=1 FL=1
MEYNGVRKVYEIKLSPKELKELIEKHFKEKINKEVKFTTKTTIEQEGSYCRESEYAKTRYFLEQEINIAELTKLAKLELSEEEIKGILKDILKQYEITYISFKSTFEYQTQYEFKTPVFKEVKICFTKEKEKLKGFKSKETPQERAQSIYDKNKGGYYEDWNLCRKF